MLERRTSKATDGDVKVGCFFEEHDRCVLEGPLGAAKQETHNVCDGA